MHYNGQFWLCISKSRQLVCRVRNLQDTWGVECAVPDAHYAERVVCRMRWSKCSVCSVQGVQCAVSACMVYNVQCSLSHQLRPNTQSW